MSIQIDYETAAESQRKELASKLIEDYLSRENRVSKLCLIRLLGQICVHMSSAKLPLIEYIKQRVVLRRVSLLSIYSLVIFV